MTNYLFIESRDPFESRDTQFVEETATALVERGHEGRRNAPLLKGCRVLLDQRLKRTRDIEQ